MTITIGLKGQREFIVEEKHTAYHLGSGGVHVFFYAVDGVIDGRGIGQCHRPAFTRGANECWGGD